MKFQYHDEMYDVVIEKKRTTKNLYIRVTKDLKVKVTANILTSDRKIKSILEESYSSICKMLDTALEKKKNNTGFYYLGKKYDINYSDVSGIEFSDSSVSMHKDFNIDEWYRKRAKVIYEERLKYLYDNFSRKVPKPSLRIRKMTTRWGVCNVNTHVITLNLELIKRDISYLDYVIVHELSHLVYGDHSNDFWEVVSENIPNYKKYRREMKVF